MAVIRNSPESTESPAESFDYDPIAMLDAVTRHTPHRFAFDARDESAARAWQTKAQAAVGEALGFLDLEKVPPQPREIQKVDRGSYVRHKIVIRTSRWSELPLYLLVPKGVKAAPVVLALHGHGYGVKDIVGLWEDGSERPNPDGYHKDFGAALAERGFVVAAPEISCFGERQFRNETFRAAGLSGSCHNAATYAMMLGGSAAGMRVMDAMRVLDYVATLDVADISRVGAMGISGG